MIAPTARQKRKKGKLAPPLNREGERGDFILLIRGGVGGGGKETTV